MSRAGYDFDAAWQRVMQAAGAGSQTALAAALGVKQSSVWDVQRRARAIPANWLVVLVEQYGVSPLWIKTGREPRLLTRSLGDIPVAELMGELGRRYDIMLMRCAGIRPPAK
ncbi:MAG: helix-turn-helix domain containing protein [Betaproteobacteria bacterium]|nr:helix-turn-helix domain containing protein [Betaproteobacteria bacterium]